MTDPARAEALLKAPFDQVLCLFALPTWVLPPAILVSFRREHATSSFGLRLRVRWSRLAGQGNRRGVWRLELEAPGAPRTSGPLVKMRLTAQPTEDDCHTRLTLSGLVLQRTPGLRAIPGGALPAQAAAWLLAYISRQLWSRLCREEVGGRLAIPSGAARGRRSSSST